MNSDAVPFPFDPDEGGTADPVRPDVVLVRATAHLPDGIRPGETYWVDRNAPYVAALIDPPSGAEPLLVLVSTREWNPDGP